MNLFHNKDLRRKIFYHKTLLKKIIISKDINISRNNLLLHLKTIIYFEKLQLLKSAQNLIESNLITNENQYQEYLNINYFHTYILYNLKKFKSFSNICLNQSLQVPMC